MTEEQIKQKAIKASDKKCVKGCSKYYRYGFQDGYIIGATETTKELQEENGTVWHDLRKDPNDLPNDDELVFANNLCTTECVRFRKEEDGSHWRHDKFELCCVVYWKEVVLPELKEVEEK